MYDAVAITTQPTSQTVCANASSVAFTTAATGSGLTYQWQYSTNGTSWSNVTGATAATYTITSPTVALNNYQYQVIVSGSSPCSSVTSSPATLSVTDVTVAASSSTICLGSAVTLSATFSTTSGTQSSSWVCATTGSGATSAVSGTSASITPTATGTYVYTFTTSGTCAFTKTVSVTVNPVPTSVTAAASSTNICAGANVNLTSSGSGTTSNVTYISPTTNGGFESGATFALNSWTALNGTYNNWFVGNAAGVQAGSNAAYIGTGNVATANASVNHIYRDIVIPAGITNISLSFYLKMAITDSGYDYLNVYTTTTANTPVAGTTPGTGYTSVFSNTSTAYSGYTLQTISLPSSLAGTTVRLVFTYVQDGVSPYSAPAIDNVSLTGLASEVLTYAWTSSP